MLSTMAKMLAKISNNRLHVSMKFNLYQSQAVFQAVAEFTEFKNHR